MNHKTKEVNFINHKIRLSLVASLVFFASAWKLGLFLDTFSIPIEDKHLLLARLVLTALGTFAPLVAIEERIKELENESKEDR